MTEVRRNPFADDPFRRGQQRPRANPFADDPFQRGQRAPTLTPDEYRRLTTGQDPSEEPASDPFAADPFRRGLRRPPAPLEEEEEESPLEQRFRLLRDNAQRQTVEDEVDDAEREREEVRSEQEEIRRRQEPEVTRSPLEEEAEQQRLLFSERARQRQEAVRLAAYQRYLEYLERLNRQEEEEEEEEEAFDDVIEPVRPNAPAPPDPLTDAERAAQQEQERRERERARQLEEERLASLEELNEAYDEQTRLQADRRAQEQERQRQRQQEQDDEEERLQTQDEQFFQEYRAGKAVADDDYDPEDDYETVVVAEAQGLTPEIIEDIYYAVIDNDPLSLTYMEYQIAYGSLRPDFAGGPRVGGGGDTGPGGQFGQRPDDSDAPEPRILDEEEEDDGEQVEEDVDVVALDNDYYYWDSNFGLVRIVDGLFADNALPLDPVVLPDDSTPFGRQALADLFASLPEDTFYDPEIQQFVHIDGEGRRIIQAELSGSGQVDDEVWQTIIAQGRGEIAESPFGLTDEDLLFYWDEELGLVEVPVGTFDVEEFPLPPAELPDDSTPAGRRRRAELFLSLPENLYYNAEIGQWIEIDDEGRHIIQADLTGWAPGRTFVGYDADGSPIFVTITDPEDGERDRESIGEIYFDETTGQWIGLDEHGRPIITDEEGNPIPLEDLDIIEPRQGAGAPGEVDLELNAYTLRPGEFLPYIYDPLQDVWIAFDANGTALLLAEGPDYTWDPLTGYFTLLNEDTGEFEIYNQEGVQIDQEGNPISGEEQEDEEDPFEDISLPTGEPGSQFDIDVDLPIVGSAFRVAEAARGAMQAAAEGGDAGDFRGFVRLDTYRESERAGYIIGGTTPDAVGSLDYAQGLTDGLIAAETVRLDVPLGDQINIAQLEIPAATDPGTFITAIEIWFTLSLDDTTGELEAEEALLPDETQLQEQITATVGEAQLLVADFVFRLLRERAPVRTGRLRDSIRQQYNVPAGRVSEARYDIGATVYYAPFVRSYRDAVELVLSQAQLYAEQFDVNIVVESALIPLETAQADAGPGGEPFERSGLELIEGFGRTIRGREVPEVPLRSGPGSDLPTLGPGISVRLGERPDFVWGDEATWLGRQISEWWRELWEDFNWNDQVDDPDREPPRGRGD